MPQEENIRVSLESLDQPCEEVDRFQVEKCFPLFRLGEYDFHLVNLPEIGLKSTYSSTLRKKIVAAFVSEIAGYKSIDHVYRKCLSPNEYPITSANRLDLRIRRFLDEALDQFAFFLDRIAPTKDVERGSVYADWTLYRVPFSMRIYAHNAQLGALFESLAIARMSVEQMAWSVRVRGEVGDHVGDFKAYEAINRLRAFCHYAGPFYGWLTRHVHWEMGESQKSMSSIDGFMAHMQASCEFKALLFAVMLILCDFMMLIASEVARQQKRTKAWMQRAAKVRRDAAALMREICLCMPDDQDIATLAAFLS